MFCIKIDGYNFLDDFHGKAAEKTLVRPQLKTY